MNIELLGTKTIVGSKDVVAFNKCLYYHGFGYEIALSLTQPKMTKKDFPKFKPVGFYIDYNGKITYTEDIYDEYERFVGDELNWEYYFNGTGIK